MTHCPGTTSGLCAYTANAYDKLNRAVRKGRASYKTSFEFHALHFLLSDAIRLLKVNQRNRYTTYRISKLLFSGESGQTMHFGSFASSSLTEDLRHFGRRTCFEIHTFRCLPQILLSLTQKRMKYWFLRMRCSVLSLWTCQRMIYTVRLSTSLRLLGFTAVSTARLWAFLRVYSFNLLHQ